jgi:glycosyltransferase involved in cell wall biosynthesis
MKIGILVVAYNAESSLRGVLGRIPADIMSKVEEIFVFDDASPDRTYEVGKELQQEFGDNKITVIRNPQNLMYGGNQRRGYQYAIERGWMSWSCCMATDNMRLKSCRNY